MTWTPEKGIKNIMGKGKDSKKDKDLDGVPNKKDCQPNNPMRQDFIGEGGATNLQRWANKKLV